MLFDGHNNLTPAKFIAAGSEKFQVHTLVPATMLYAAKRNCLPYAFLKKFDMKIEDGIKDRSAVQKYSLTDCWRKLEQLPNEKKQGSQKNKKQKDA